MIWLRRKGKHMEKNVYALVIMAAGIGARFSGGVKQLKAVGPHGETLMEYAISDAVAVGFRKLVFVLRKDILEEFQATIGKRVEEKYRSFGLTVEYAFQEREDLPGGYVCPPERTKPWGTGQALLACRGVLREPFAVINADDYYGRSSFRKIMDFLSALPANSVGHYCLVGFQLGNTLSEHGGVTRGLCKCDEAGYLVELLETRGIVKTPDGAAKDDIALDCNTPVSMNMWGFTPDVLDCLARQFEDFLREDLQNLTAEFVLPEVIDVLLREKKARVCVLPTEEQWYGMTFGEDLPKMQAVFADKPL